jgi:Ca2+-binding RTX toxin-like protein
MTSMTSAPARRGLLALLALAGALLLACASGAVATAAANPVARPTCTGPSSLGCVTCPAPAATCADPTGFVAKGVPVTFDASSSSFSPPATKFSDITWSYATPTSSQSHSGAPQATFTFGDDRTVAVRLEVVDDTGGTGSAVMNVVVGARLLATPSPGIVLGAGTLSDSAQVVGRVNPSSSATVDFRLYGPDDALCTGTPAFQQLGVRYSFGNGSVSSGAFTPTLVGTYRWTVAYGNDANNTPDPSTCAGATFVSAPPPPPAPPVGPSSPAPSSGATPIKGVTTCAGRLATIVAVAGKRTITGTPGPDVIVGGPGDDKIDGRGGNDTICGGPGDDEIRGGAGNDRLYGNDGADLVLGGAGNDYVHGGNGRDRLAGQDGNDHVLGAAGNDLLDDQKLGGKGSDELDGGSGADNIRAADHTTDTIDCGTGRDTVRMDPRDHETLCESVHRQR